MTNVENQLLKMLFLWIRAQQQKSYSLICNNSNIIADELEVK